MALEDLLTQAGAFPFVPLSSRQIQSGELPPLTAPDFRTQTEDEFVANMEAQQSRAGILPIDELSPFAQEQPTQPPNLAGESLLDRLGVGIASGLQGQPQARGFGANFLQGLGQGFSQNQLQDMQRRAQAEKRVRDAAVILNKNRAEQARKSREGRVKALQEGSKEAKKEAAKDRKLAARRAQTEVTVQTPQGPRQANINSLVGRRSIEDIEDELNRAKELQKAKREGTIEANMAAGLGPSGSRTKSGGSLITGGDRSQLNRLHSKIKEAREAPVKRLGVLEKNLTRTQKFRLDRNPGALRESAALDSVFVRAQNDSTQAVPRVAGAFVDQFRTILGRVKTRAGLFEWLNIVDAEFAKGSELETAVQLDPRIDQMLQLKMKQLGITPEELGIGSP